MGLRVPYLKHLVSESGLVAWHSLDQASIASGDPADLVADETGGFDLTATGTAPEWQRLATDEPYIDFDGAADPLDGSGSSATIKHLFVLAAYSAAAFPAGGDGYKGLVSRASGLTDGIAAGDPNTTKFFDFSYSGLEYYKSGTYYATSNMQAPVNGVPELCEFKYPTGWTVGDIQIGQDRAFTARKWSGPVYALIAYDRLVSGVELSRLRLYGQLRSRNWITLGQTLDFPSPAIIWGSGYETYSTFKAEEFDWQEITDTHEYEDGTRSFNEIAPSPPRRWTVSMTGLSAEQAQFLDAFADNVRLTKTFNFYDYRRDRTYDGVRVARYRREHDAHRSWRNSCQFDLVRY